jgi:hypothetical protein
MPVKSYLELKTENLELQRKIKDLEDEIVRIKRKAKIIDVDGWKGKSGLDIKKEQDEWIITEWRKQKEDGAIEEMTTRVPTTNVNMMWAFVKKHCPRTNMIVKYRTIVPTIIQHNGWTDVDVVSFNGGKNRAKYYFPNYYYPCKVLENKGYIDYSGRGIIKRLK